MPQGVAGLVYIGRSINPEPSDQTDLNKWRRCNLGGGGEPTYEWGADRWALGASHPTGGAGRPHLMAPRPPLWCGVLSSLLEPSRVVFAVDKRD